MERSGGLVSIIGDEDTVTGFLLAGVGHRDQKNAVNYLVVDPEKTKHSDLVGAFKSFTSREDISIILITQTIANEIRYLINAYDKVIPTVLEIPSKDKPYNEAQDPIMQRVLKLLGSRD
jgi:V-type H+-transporting ATPase subunit F